MIWEEDMKLPRQQFVRLAASAATLPAASLVDRHGGRAEIVFKRAK
jgi:hypothetical protein